MFVMVGLAVYALVMSTPLGVEWYTKIPGGMGCFPSNARSRVKGEISVSRASERESQNRRLTSLIVTFRVSLDMQAVIVRGEILLVRALDSKLSGDKFVALGHVDLDGFLLDCDCHFRKRL